MLSEELLKQASEELGIALIESLPEPEQCQQQLDDVYKEVLEQAENFKKYAN